MAVISNAASSGAPAGTTRLRVRVAISASRVRRLVRPRGRRDLHDRGRLVTERPAPRRTDPIAAALAFAIREAVRLEAEPSRLPAAPHSAKVVAMERKPEARVA